MANPLESFQNMPTWGKFAIVGGGGLVAYYAYKQHQNAAAATSSTTQANGDVTDPTTGTSYPATSIDPETNQTYGAEIASYGSVAAADSAYGYTSGGATGTEGSVGVTANTTGVVGTTSGYGSNAVWSQNAESGLSQIGFDPTTVADALGAYLANQPLTPAQVSIVNDAISEYGLPPTGNFTTPVAAPTLATTPPPATTTTTTAPPTTTATTAPKSSPTPMPPAAPSRIDISGTTSNSISTHWTDVPGATSYKIDVTYQSQTVKSMTAGTYSTVITGLTPDHTYGIHISSVGPGGTSSAASTWAKTAK